MNSKTCENDHINGAIFEFINTEGVENVCPEDLHLSIEKYYKVKLSLCFIKHHATKTYWGSGGYISRHS
jgi:hypothetical protein